MKVSVSHYGYLSNGQEVKMIQLENPYLKVQLLDYGARLLSFVYKTPANVDQELVLGSWPLAVYEHDDAYHGAVVGRTCNRIANSKFVLGGETFSLEANEGRHHLHGGVKGFHQKIWRTHTSIDAVTFSLSSPAGESGYPGNCDVTVEVSLDSNSLVYNYSGHSDADTLLDLTNHAYFCLDDSGTILNHELSLSADQYVPVDEELIPTGELQSVALSPFDFRKSKRVGSDISVRHDQLQRALGFDHSWLLRGNTVQYPAACLYSPKSNIELSLFTTSPALQFYSGNHLELTQSGLCLEAQHLPNACNQDGFVSPELKVGQVYSQSTRFQITMRS